MSIKIQNAVQSLVISLAEMKVEMDSLKKQIAATDEGVDARLTMLEDAPKPTTRRKTL